MSDTNTPIESAHKKRRWPVKLALFGATLITAVIATTLITIAVWSSSVQSELNGIRGDIAAENLPDTLEELDAWYPAVPDAENAALVYARAVAELNTVDPDLDRVTELHDATSDLEYNSEYPVDYIDELRSFVADAAPGLAILKQAAELPQARYPVDLKLGYDMDLSHLAPLRNAARVLVQAIELALLEQDVASAVEYQLAMVPIGVSLEKEPTLIPQLVKIAIDGIAVHSLERLLNHTRPTDTQLQELDTAFKSAIFPGALRRAMIGERCQATATTREVYKGTMEANPELQPIMIKRGSLPRQLIDIYSKYEQLHLYRAFEPIMASADPDLPALVKFHKENPDREMPFAIMAAVLVPAMDRVHLAVARDTASLRLARTAIAVERYRLNHGTLPKTLADCVPMFIESVPQDPFDGESIRYKREANSFTVYSVFDDLDDDGGVSWTKDENYVIDGDVAFKVER